FIRNFVLNQFTPIQFNRDIQNIDNEIQKSVRESKSGIYIEEAFAKATVSLFGPTTNTSDKEKSIQLLKLLIKSLPNNAIWQSSIAFELIASLDDDSILRFASGISKNFSQAQNLHPAKLFYAGVIQEKLGNKQQAIQLFKKLAEGDAYNEQGYEFDALMKLAKYFASSNPSLSKHYLANLIKYKDYINAKDNQYKEAKAMLSKWPKGR
ncbi:MAG TPA: hypothetical protein VK625_22010, partial [Flavitalea sp.]|nr:hypothetical protein [Flavitalea sp.]